MNEELSKKLDQIEYQIKFLADAYKVLHNMFINGIKINFEKNVIDPTINKLNDKIKEFCNVIQELNQLNKNEAFIGTLSFMSKKLHDLEDKISCIKEEGINKTIHLDLTMEGYEMIKKPVKRPFEPEENSISPEDALSILLNSLSNQEEKVISLKYGLLGYDKTTLYDITKIMGISSIRVKQLSESAMRKLADPLIRNKVLAITHKKLKKDILGKQ